MKIMIVDDHSGIREMLRGLLTSRGVDLTECEDGKEALATYGDFHPDWVFMDSAMKNLDGISATRELLSRHPEARVVMVSDEDAEQLRRAAWGAGATGFVRKDELLLALTQNPNLASSQLESLWTGAAKTRIPKPRL